MKRIAILAVLAASATLTVAQTPAKPAPKPAVGTAAKPAVRTGGATSAVKLPPGVPPVKGLVKTAFSLRYQEIKLGTGAEAEPGKVYKVQYTGWLAADGKKFDSSYDHRPPVMDKDGKPVNDADGKPKLGDPQPLAFPQGRGRLIPGWDQGFAGMKVGGKRRLFIPYQLAYGALGHPPVIPSKSDLIFDVELVDVMDMPTQPMQGMPPGGRPMPGGGTGGVKMIQPKPAAPPPPPSPAPTPAPAPAPAPAKTPDAAAPPTPPPAPQK